jgi:hypothetical protein
MSQIDLLLLLVACSYPIHILPSIELLESDLLQLIDIIIKISKAILKLYMQI